MNISEKLIPFKMGKHPAIGVECGKHSMKCALVSTQRGSLHIEALRETPFDSNVKPLDIAFDSAHREALATAVIATSLKSSQVLVRPLQIPLKKDREIAAVVKHEAEPLIPYPIEEAVVSTLTVGRTHDGTQLMVLSTKKEFLAAHLSHYGEKSIEPEVVCCIPVALMSFATEVCASPNTRLLIHLGDDETSCVLVQDGKLLASYSFAIGISSLADSCTADGNEDLQRIDFQNMSPMAHPKLCKAVERWLQETTRTVFAMQKGLTKQEPLDGFVLAGEGVTLQNLSLAIAERLQLSLHAVDKDLGVPLLDLLRYAVPLGLAFHAMAHAPVVNFRQEEHAYPHPWKRLKQPVVCYCALAVLVAGMLYLVGEQSLSHREDALRQHYAELVASTNRTLTAFEEEFRSKNKMPEVDLATFSPSRLTKEEVSARLIYLDKLIKSSPDVFPLHPNTARVSDFLAWLAVHPQVTTEKEGAVVNIESLAYTMVKRPDNARKSEKYQVKVDLEFTTPSAKEARQFHDSLIEPNAMIDPKGEVKWSASRGKYRTSFFLRDKTSYPAAGAEGTKS